MSDLPVPNATSADADLPKPDETGGRTDDALAALEQRYAALQDRANEERFCWIVVTVILLDSLFWNNVQSIGVPIAIFALELLLFTVLATKFGLSEVNVFITAALNGLVSRKDT